MDVIAGETIKPNSPVEKTSSNDDVIQGEIIRDSQIAAVKARSEELQKSVEGSFIDPSLINRGMDAQPIVKESVGKKLYSIYCEPCGFKKITDGSDVAGLIPYKQSMIPGGIPYRDPVSGQIKTPPARNNSKKFKCPNCGRVVTVRKVADPNTQTGRSFDE